MGYLTDYKERHGKCEFCVNNNGSYSGCHECYGSNFKDRLDLLTFINNEAERDALFKFESSDKGKELKAAVEKADFIHREAHNTYDAEKAIFIKDEVDRIMSMLDVSV